jgi:hypothetical protein
VHRITPDVLVGQAPVYVDASSILLESGCSSRVAIADRVDRTEVKAATSHFAVEREVRLQPVGVINEIERVRWIEIEHQAVTPFFENGARADDSFVQTVDVQARASTRLSN